MPRIKPRTLAKRTAKIAQIRQELTDGQMRQAFTRAKGLLAIYPYCCEVRAVFAETYHAAGDHMSAGLHWSLSGSQGAEVERCVALFERFIGDDPAAHFEAYRFPDLPFGQFDAEPVNTYLARLEHRLLDIGYSFRYLPKSSTTKNGGWRLVLAVLVCCVLLPIGLMVAGVIQVVSWLTGH